MIWTWTHLRGRWFTWSLGLSDPTSVFSLWSHLCLTPCYTTIILRRELDLTPPTITKETFDISLCILDFDNSLLKIPFWSACVLIPQGMRELPMTHIQEYCTENLQRTDKVSSNQGCTMVINREKNPEKCNHIGFPASFCHGICPLFLLVLSHTLMALYSWDAFFQFRFPQVRVMSCYT